MRDMDARAGEAERRRVAQEHRGEVVAESGKALEGRSVPQMVSVRLDPELVGELRALARARGTSVSELLREGAALVASKSRMVNTWVHVSRIVAWKEGEQPWLPYATTVERESESLAG